MAEIINDDALNALSSMPENSIDCCVTSPPYYRLRDYGVDGQIGLEDTPEQYIARLVSVFREVRRVLKDNGTLWVNIADSYSGSGKGAAMYPESTKGTIQGTNAGSVNHPAIAGVGMSHLPAKNMLGIPWMLAFALRDDGWILRQEIIWSKPNPMPESVTDRCTKSHESIFLLSKCGHYYFDAEAISEQVTASTVRRLSQNIRTQSGSALPGRTNGAMKACKPRYCGSKYTENPDIFSRTKSGNIYAFRARRNKRDVWSISTTPYKGLHFATFPEELARTCILAGCKPGGVVLDPFSGSGTTGVVAAKWQRDFILIDLNSDYCDMARQRTDEVLCMPSIFDLMEEK